MCFVVSAFPKTLPRSKKAIGGFSSLSEFVLFLVRAVPCEFVVIFLKD